MSGTLPWAKYRLMIGHGEQDDERGFQTKEKGASPPLWKSSIAKASGH